MRDILRMQQVQSPIIPIIGDMVRNHPGTISLGQGVVHYGPPQEAIDQIEHFLKNPENHKYHAVEGIPQLRQLIQDKLAQENDITIGDGASEFCVTAGGNMAFMNAVLAITDPGDEIILLTPYYFNHEMAIQIAGSVPVYARTGADYQADLGAIDAAITDKTRAVVSVSPNNPSGAVYPESTLRDINRLCQERGIYHINDEAYEYFTYEGAEHFSPGSMKQAADHTISLFSLSKAYGFASWRIGYMVYPSRLNVSIKKIQDTILICPPLVSQYAAYGAMQAGAAYCRQFLPDKADVRSIMLEELDNISGLCRVAHTQGAFYLLIKVDATISEMELAERLIKEHGIAVMPGKSFGMTESGYFRLSYGALQKETAIEGIGRLTQGLKDIVGV